MSGRDANLQQVIDQLSCLWSAEKPIDFASETLEQLLPGTSSYFYTWTGEDKNQVLRLGGSGDIPIEKSTWILSGDAVDLRPFDPRGTCPVCNQVFRIETLGQIAPAGYQTFVATFMDELSLGPYGESILYHKDEFLACLAFGREKGDPAFTDEEIEDLQHVVPLLSNLLYARSVLEKLPLNAGGIIGIADAVCGPVFIVDDLGRPIYINAKARMLYRKVPEWLEACVNPKHRAPAWVKRVPMAFETTRLWMLLPEPLATDPNSAHEQVWARRWKLSPRHARVAALLMRGLADKEISTELNLSLSTVRTYVKELFARVGVHGRGELVAAALGIQ